MTFRDREEAARLLARRLVHLKGERPLVLGIPRGAVPMARILAEELEGDLDVVLVRKLGAPGNPELAIGAVTEAGEVETNDVARALGVTHRYVQDETARQTEVLRARRRALAGHPPADPSGRVLVVVDDGVATGATMCAALDALRRRLPRRIVVAVGIASAEALRRLRLAADEVVCLESPDDFFAVGQAYEDFSPVSDAEVVEELRRFRESRTHRSVRLRDGRAEIEGDLVLPPGAHGVVLFAHGSGSSRRSPRNRYVAERLNAHVLATLLLDLLTPAEDHDPDARFDIGLLTRRLGAAAAWLRRDPATRELDLGLYGASTGAAAALRLAAAEPDVVRAVVSRGGRPDLADEALPAVRAPTLLIVGGDDTAVLALNRESHMRLGARDKRIEVVPGATHLFEEPGALERVAEVSAGWFESRLAAHAVA